MIKFGRKKAKEEAPKTFVEAVNRFAYNEKGTKMLIEKNWEIEYYGAIELENDETLITGCAQIGKTLAVVLFMIYTAVERQYNCGWFYPQREILNKLVPLQFKPMIRAWLESKGIKLPQSSSQNNILFQVRNASINFSYLSGTGKAKAGGKGAVAGAATVGFSIDFGFIEEASQNPLGATAPAERRLDASRVASAPLTKLGTPGNGQGIEYDIKFAHHYFYPHCMCRYCDKEIVLNPKGTLLKKQTKTNLAGEQIETYLGDSGRPVDWHHKDPTNPIDSAYFACPHCLEEIPEEDRVHKSYFRCLYTGTLLKDFLATD